MERRWSFLWGGTSIHREGLDEGLDEGGDIQAGGRDVPFSAHKKRPDKPGVGGMNILLGINCRVYHHHVVAAVVVDHQRLQRLPRYSVLACLFSELRLCAAVCVAMEKVSSIHAVLSTARVIFPVGNFAAALAFLRPTVEYVWCELLGQWFKAFVQHQPDC